MLVSIPDTSVLGTRERTAQLAAQRLGRLPGTFHDYFNDFCINSQSTNLMSTVELVSGFLINGGGTGSASHSAELGGILKISSGATAGGSANAYSPTMLGQPSNSFGYAAARMRMPNSIDSVTDAGFFVIVGGGASQFGVGHAGGLSTANIIFAYDTQGTPKKVDLLVTDALFHVYEIWYGTGDGKYHVAVDGAEVGSGVTPSTPTASAVGTWFRAANGATNAARGVDPDYLYLAGGFAAS